MIDGLDVVYQVRETRPVWKTRPIALGLTLLAGTLLLVAVGLMVEGRHWDSALSADWKAHPEPRSETP